MVNADQAAAAAAAAAAAVVCPPAAVGIHSFNPLPRHPGLSVSAWLGPARADRNQIAVNHTTNRQPSHA